MPTKLQGIPHLDQWLGPWAMEESQFWAGFEFMRKVDLHVHLQSGAVERAQAEASDSRRKPFAIAQGDIAVVGIHGRMMKQVASMEDGTSTVMARRAIRAAAADPDVSAIALHIDSPGGTVAGTADLAADVANAAKQKPVWAFIEDLGASAAYWVASQAQRISANGSGLVGSIGTYGLVYDFSGAAAMEGVKAYVLRAGKFKGMGAAGTEITQEQLAEWQRTVDGLNEHFLSGVAAGRRMSMDQVREIADGRVHIAKDAKRLNLIDAVESFDETVSRLGRESRKNRKGSAMSDQILPDASQQAEPILARAVGTLNVGETAASYADIKNGCPGADSNFICSQLENKATVSQAQQAWMLEQQKRIEKANADAEAARTKKPGVEAVGSPKSNDASKSYDGDPVAEFNSKVRELMTKGTSRLAASQSVAANNRELHAAYLLATNPGAKTQRLIREKFE